MDTDSLLQIQPSQRIDQFSILRGMGFLVLVLGWQPLFVKNAMGKRSSFQTFGFNFGAHF